MFFSSFLAITLTSVFAKECYLFVFFLFPLNQELNNKKIAKGIIKKDELRKLVRERILKVVKIKYINMGAVLIKIRKGELIGHVQGIKNIIAAISLIGA